MLKTICVIACAIICLFVALPVQAFADSDVQWVRVVDNDVRLYANCDSSKAICELQKSYYLQVWGEENGMYLVSIMQNEAGFPTITGYVWKAEVKICDKTPLPPYYPTETLTVNTDSAQLRLSPVPSAETVITVTNTQKVSYYGEISSYGQTWYYVCYCGKFGYVPHNAVTLPVIAMHPTPLDTPVVVQPSDPTDTPKEPNTPTSGSTTEIVLIVFVAVLAVGISLALFLPGNLKKRDKDMFDSEI